MDARAAAARWCATWRDAWPAADADGIVALYAPHATFSTQPFREPFRGPDGVREYVTRVLSEEEDQRVWMSEPIVDGDRASISWWASLRDTLHSRSEAQGAPPAPHPTTAVSSRTAVIVASCLWGTRRPDVGPVTIR